MGTPLDIARIDLAQQVFRYQNKCGVPESVTLALRDTIEGGPKEHRVLVSVLGSFLRFDGGDYGLRRAFDAYCAVVNGGGK